jgi:hypothetical protein
MRAVVDIVEFFCAGGRTGEKVEQDLVSPGFAVPLPAWEALKRQAAGS